jgi:tRNA(Arg) A34 adenosine deaminase TadA
MYLATGYWARLRKIYYANTRRDAAKIGFDDAVLYREVARPISRRKIFMKQLHCRPIAIDSAAFSCGFA